MDAPDTADRERGQRLEEALAALLYEGAADDGFGDELDSDELEEAASLVRRMVLERRYRGSGSLADWFPLTLEAWRKTHPDDTSLDELMTAFCASRACRAWREPHGISLEEAYFRFFSHEKIGDPATREEELAAAVVRSLAVTPRASFVWPSVLRTAPGGCFTVTSRLALHAALDGKVHQGPITPLVASLLAGDAPEAVARRFGATVGDVHNVMQALRAMRLLA